MTYEERKIIERDLRNYYKQLVEILNNISSIKKLNKERIQRELRAIKRSNSQKSLVISYELINRLKKENISYFVMGGIGNSYIAFLLGITKINPLSIKKCEFPYELAFGTKEVPKKFDLELQVGSIDSIKDLIIETLAKHGQFVWLLGNEFSYLERARNKIRCIINLTLIPLSRKNEPPFRYTDRYVPIKVKDEIFPQEIPMNYYNGDEKYLPKFTFYNSPDCFAYDRLIKEFGKPKDYKNQKFINSYVKYHLNSSIQPEDKVTLFDLSKMKVQKSDPKPRREGSRKSLMVSERFCYIQELLYFFLKYEKNREKALELTMMFGDTSCYNDEKKVKTILSKYPISENDIKEISKITFLHDAQLNIVNTLNSLKLNFYRVNFEKNFNKVYKDFDWFLCADEWTKELPNFCCDKNIHILV